MGWKVGRLGLIERERGEIGGDIGGEEGEGFGRERAIVREVGERQPFEVVGCEAESVCECGKSGDDVFVRGGR